MKRRLGVLAAYPVVAPEERRLAGVISGILYALGGFTLAFYLILPGVGEHHREAVVGLAAGAFVWGVCSIFTVDWREAPDWLIHVVMSMSLGLIAVGVASTGGANSPAWVYLLLPAVFSAYFYRPIMAMAYIGACVVFQMFPLIYDTHAAVHGGFLAQLAVAGPAYVVLGGAIIRSRGLTAALRTRAERLAAEQSALRRVATAVVDGESPQLIYELAAREVALLLRAGAAGIIRFDDPETATVMGSWADRPDGRYLPGTAISIKPGSDVAQARGMGIPVRIDSHAEGSPVDRLGYTSSLIAPVLAAGRPWGALAVTANAPFSDRDEDRLLAFGDLLTTAISSIEDRAKLAAQASSDPLTGLANHRTLQSRLAAEVSRAARHGHPLSVAVLDVDNFKHVNDSSGHETGDDVLVRVAQCLQRLARTEDTLGRVGGDEFAWILPETNREQALIAVERARRVIATVSTSTTRITVSAGICDTTVTEDPAQLIHLADGALYWSKAHGRNQSWIYDPETVNELSAQERAERLERSQALLGLRALARAIDAKDPATKKHSERVSELAVKLARSAGWSKDRTMLLAEAALVHDVGKIGIPDAVLRKPSPLTPEERLQVTEHSELSARIVEDVLNPEQVEWIRTHHERPDGEGYPDGLRGDEIPDGGALLALADAFDVMTVSRPYGVPKPLDVAVAEVLDLEGKQFSVTAVAAIMQLYAEGELGPARRERARVASA